jgi:hypothetical protein
LLLTAHLWAINIAELLPRNQWHSDASHSFHKSAMACAGLTNPGGLMAILQQRIHGLILRAISYRTMAAIPVVVLAACGGIGNPASNSASTADTAGKTVSTAEISPTAQSASLISTSTAAATASTSASNGSAPPSVTASASTTSDSGTSPQAAGAATPSGGGTPPQAAAASTPAVATGIPNAANFVTIREDLGSSRTNYPLQLGRAFAKGQFAGAVQLKYNGTSIPTQTDVKNRWSDGSIRFAVLSAVIPNIAASSQAKVDFESVAAPASVTAPSLATFLSYNPTFDASITATVSGTANVVTLRQMLSQGAVAEPWVQGPIASTYIVADHSAQRRFDFGASALKSIRPIMHVTIWHTLAQAKIRFIAENSNTEGLENVTYDLNLIIGTGSEAKTVYSQTSVPHHYGARWTKTAWYGGTPQALSVDQNAGYLSSLRLIPNYDPASKLSESQILAQVTRWTGVTKKLFDSGFWQKSMPNVGGREEIALFPNWTVDALLSGDARLQEISDGHAEMASVWPMHFREGSSSKFYDAARTIPSIGKAVSLFARPTMFYFDNSFMDQSWAIANVADRYVWGIGTSASSFNGWAPDGAHEPAPFLVPYLTTGEYFWLEEMQFWASWAAFNPQPNTTSGFYGRGPALTSAALNGDIRRQAWILRNRVSAAAFSVDNTPEKAYFDYLMSDAIAIAEGVRGITGGSGEGSASYAWGQTVGRAGSPGGDSGLYGGLGINPLHFWDVNQSGTEAFAITYQSEWNTPIKRAQAPFQMAYMILALDHAKGLGYPTDRLLNWAAVFITEATKNNQTAWLLGNFVVPVATTTPLAYITNWSNVFSAYADPSFAETYTNQWLNSADGPPNSMAAATATIADLPGGLDSWNWVKANWVNRRIISAPARWAIVPRSN